MNKISKAFLRWFVKFGWVARLWYAFTMVCSYKKGFSIPIMYQPEDISKFLRYGSLYKSDPWRGILDVAFHPTHTQRMLVTGTKTYFDCEDHAAYSCAVLKKSDMADDVWLCFFYMEETSTGKVSGHSVYVYQKDGKQYWGDYFEPTKFDNEWDWATLSANRFQATPIGACMIHVRGLSKRDRPLLGSYKCNRFVNV